MKGYKAFGSGMVCRGKQYAENTVYEEEKAVVCEAGMHFCKDPLECLNYYPLINDDGKIVEMAEVEALDECKTDDNKKFVTKKLKIGAKLDLNGIVSAAIGVIKEETTFDFPTDKISSGDDAKIGSSGDAAKIGSSGDDAKIGSSGDAAKIGSSGDAAKIGSSGDAAQIGSSGRYAQIGSSGDAAKIGSSGDAAKIGSSGRYAKICSSGDDAQIGSSGRYAKIGSSGDAAKIGSSGRYAKIGSSGRYAKICSSGDDAIVTVEADHAVVACVGKRGRIKAPIGTWITLAEYGEYDGNGFPVICVKSAQIDGEILLPDVFYTLKNGEFVADV